MSRRLCSSTYRLAAIGGLTNWIGERIIATPCDPHNIYHRGSPGEDTVPQHLGHHAPPIPGFPGAWCHGKRRSGWPSALHPGLLYRGSRRCHPRVPHPCCEPGDRCAPSASRNPASLHGLAEKSNGMIDSPRPDLASGLRIECTVGWPVNILATHVRHGVCFLLWMFEKSRSVPTGSGKPPHSGPIRNFPSQRPCNWTHGSRL